MKDITILLVFFADDMLVLSENINDLQNSLNNIYQYCSKWGLEVLIRTNQKLLYLKNGVG